MKQCCSCCQTIVSLSVTGEPNYVCGGSINNFIKSRKFLLALLSEHSKFIQGYTTMLCILVQQCLSLRMKLRINVYLHWHFCFYLIDWFLVNHTNLIHSIPCFPEEIMFMLWWWFRFLFFPDCVLKLIIIHNAARF